MNDLIKIVKQSVKDLSINWIIFLPSLALLFVLIFLSKISLWVNSYLKTTFTLTTWLIVFSVISLAIISFFFAGIIGMCKEAIKKRTHFKDFFFYAKKYWFSNLVIVLTILISYNIIRWAAHYLALFIGRIFGFPVSVAQIIFFIIYFSGLLCIIIFFSLSNFYLILNDLSVIEGVRKSIKIVKKRYLDVLAILVFFYVLNFVLEKIVSGTYLDIANVLLAPFLAIILTKFASVSK